MSNLYKQRYVVSGQNVARVINSNDGVAAKLEELRAQMEHPDGFVEGLVAPVVEVEPKEPEITLEELRAQAEEELEAARAQAEQMIADAQAQVESITEQAKEAGRHQGYDVGWKKAQEALELEEQGLEERRKELEQEYAEMRDALEPQILDAVCDVFEKVFSIEFDQHKKILLHLIKNAILKIESTREFQIRVCEGNYPYVEEHRMEILSQVGQNIQLSVEADASLDVSQCIIETDSGFFECGIDVQFENLIKALRALSV